MYALQPAGLNTNHLWGNFSKSTLLWIDKVRGRGRQLKRLRALMILSSNGSTGTTGPYFQFWILDKVFEMLIPSI